MYTNSKIIGKLFGDEIKKRLSNAEHVEIASGYFGYKELEQISPQLLKIAKRGSCKLLFGMIYREKATNNQRKCLLELNKKLKEINPSSGIFLTYPLYHGKVYKFVKNDETTIIVGSSNLSGSGLRSNIEFNLEITDKSTKDETVSFLDFLFKGEGFRKGVSVPLYEELLTLKKTNTGTKDGKTLKDFEIDKNLFPKDEFINSFKIFYRPNKRFISALNLYFGKGRKIIKNGEVIYTPRPWYEVEISTIKEEREHKDYPKGSWDAYVEDDGKYYELKMITSSGDKDSPKAIQTSDEGGGREVLGELIKGRMERMGVLKKYEQITDEILDEYGKNYIELAKIGNKKYLMKV